MKTVKLFSTAGLFFFALTVTSCSERSKDTDSSGAGVMDDSKPTIDTSSLKDTKRDSATAMQDTIVPPPLGVPSADKNNPDITK